MNPAQSPHWLPAYQEAQQLLHQGQLDAAQARYFGLLLQPDATPLCLQDLGRIAARLGQLPRAIGLYQHALRLNPTLFDAYGFLVEAYDALRELPRAEHSLLELGNILLEREQRAAAITVYRRLLDRNPRHYGAAVNLGNALAWQGQGVEARTHLLCGLQLLGRARPELAAFWQCLSALCPDLPRCELPGGLPTGPLDHGEKALTTLGKLFLEQGNPAAGRLCNQHAVQVAPGEAHCHWNYALACLRAYDFVTGWSEHEWRWHWDGFPDTQRVPSCPLWPADPQSTPAKRLAQLRGKRLLVWAEQGFGDTFQFLPLLQRLQQHEIELSFETLHGLERLCAENLPGIRILSRPNRPEALPDGAYDYQVPLLSLPQRLGSTRADLPLATRYLRANTEDTARWQTKAESLPGRRLGLAWAGRPGHSKDAQRSLDLLRLAPLLDVPGISWISLQVGPTTTPADQDTRIHDWGAEMGDFADTAAALSAIDLLIAVDTGTAHLAAALGKPVWLLLDHIGDWRWGSETEHTPWYPTVRIFRQSEPGDWAGIMERVRVALVQEGELPAQTP